MQPLLEGKKTQRELLHVPSSRSEAIPTPELCRPGSGKPFSSCV